MCRNVKAAETRSFEDGLDEAIHYARMVREIFDGFVDLKYPKQIEVEAVTDNKSLLENLNNTCQCEEKMLRNSIAVIKEMVDRTDVKTVEWVDMLADALAKKGGNDSWIKEVLKSYIIVKKKEGKFK